MEWGYLLVGTLLITLGAAGSIATAVGGSVGPVALAVGTAAIAVGLVLVGISGRIGDAHPV